MISPVIKPANDEIKNRLRARLPRLHKIGRLEFLVLIVDAALRLTARKPFESLHRLAGFRYEHQFFN